MCNKQLLLQFIVAYIASMELNNLRIFVDVMRRGSFAAVARDHDMSPSSVSRAIANLEAELGVRLLQRTTRQMQPTEAGQLYFQRIEPAVDELQQAQLAASDISQQPAGTLRITTSNTFGNMAIMPLIPEFAQRYPGLSLDVVMTEANLDLLAEGIDVAVRLGTLNDSSLVATRLYDMDFVICASPAYLQKHGVPQNPEDLSEHNCLLFPMPGYYNHWVFRDGQGNISTMNVNGQISVSNALALKQCAMHDMGISLLTRWTVWREIEEGSLVQLFPDYDVTASDFDNAIWLVYPSKGYLPMKVRLLIDFLKEKFQQGVYW